MKKLLLGLLFAIGFFISLFSGYRLFWPIGGESQELSLDVPPGQSFYKIAEELAEKRLIRSSWDMKVLVKLAHSPSLPQGLYKLSSEMSLWRIFQKIRRGREELFSISFPEGFNHYEMGELLKSQNWPAGEFFLKRARDKKLIQKLLKQNFNSFEGYLFPDTYHLGKYTSAEDLIEMMTKKQKEVYKKLSPLPLPIPLSTHQIVTLASLIEKETGQAKERALIAGVFYNRLRKNMKLQTDPSILYALYLVQGFEREKNIRKKDILFPSAYNTYVIQGLPPGPIANPGEKSLQAVFTPEPSDYLYFVSKNDGSHKFSKNYKEHKKAVYKYQIQPFQK